MPPNYSSINGPFEDGNFEINGEMDGTRPLILCKEHDYAWGSFKGIKKQVSGLFGGGRRSSRVPRPPDLRFIDKNGERNTQTRNIPLSLKRYSLTVFQVLVNLKWPQQFLFACVAFIMTWFIFGLLWYCLEQVMLSYRELGCIAGVDSLYSAFLFSIETQSSIGYGNHYVKDTCQEGVFLLLTQIVVGILIESTVVAIVIAKLTHPKWRRRNVVFSEQLCVFEDRGSKIVAFRIADLSSGEISLPEAHVRVYLIHSMQSSSRKEGCLAMEELDIGFEKGHDRILLLVPWVVEHVVTPKSPLFNKSKEEIEEGVFEIVVILEGSVEESGSITQCMKSYTCSDIRWGYNFNTMISKRAGKFSIDFSKLNSCSPTQLIPDESILQSSSTELPPLFSTDTEATGTEKLTASTENMKKRTAINASFKEN